MFQFAIDQSSVLNQSSMTRFVNLQCAVLLLAVLPVAPTWTSQVSGVPATLRGVSAASDRVAWASGSGSTVLRTADGGETWQRIAVTTDRVDFRDVDAIDERTAYLLSIG